MYVFAAIVLACATFQVQAVSEPKKNCGNSDGGVIRHGESIKQDCNTCYCYNGALMCTLMGCLEFQPCKDSEGNVIAQHGELYKDDCNTCHCSNGEAACTKKDCSAFQTRPCRDSDGKVVAQHGDRYKKDCNFCFCSNGLSLCTKKKCPAGDQ